MSEAPMVTSKKGTAIPGSRAIGPMDQAWSFGRLKNHSMPQSFATTPGSRLQNAARVAPLAGKAKLLLGAIPGSPKKVDCSVG